VEYVQVLGATQKNIVDPPTGTDCAESSNEVVVCVVVSSANVVVVVVVGVVGVVVVVSCCCCCLFVVVVFVLVVIDVISLSSHFSSRIRYAARSAEWHARMGRGRIGWKGELLLCV
jgi:hypothetical protein